MHRDMCVHFRTAILYDDSAHLQVTSLKVIRRDWALCGHITPGKVQAEIPRLFSNLNSNM